MAALWEENLDVHEPVEVHWGTSTILAIFFAASLISAVFFGLGYSFGGSGTPRSAAAIPSPVTSSNASLPAALPKLSTQTAGSGATSAAANTQQKPTAHSAEAAAPKPTAEVRQVSAAHIAQPTATVAARTATPAVPVHETAAAATTASSKTRTMVQVGAIGNRKDAQRLVAQLRKKGFHAGIYEQKNDKFLHVQIGPFKDSQQAQSMRHQVMASGFHAILKNAS